MHYETIQPPVHLRGHVRFFWTLESHGTNPTPKTFGPIADGCPGIIFQHAHKGIFYDQQQKRLPEIFLFGQTTKHMQLHTTGNLHAIGVYLYPTALNAVFGLNAFELTNSCLDLDDLAVKQGLDLSEQLVNTDSKTEQIELLSSWLYSQIRKNKPKEEGAVQYILGRISQAKGNVSLKDLQAEVRMTERSFERKFKQSVGISPKLYSRVCRFQASLQQLRNNQYKSLTDIAFENGYADQSHFIRAFKEFAGFSPWQYQKQSKELVQNFPELLK